MKKPKVTKRSEKTLLSRIYLASLGAILVSSFTLSFNHITAVSVAASYTVWLAALMPILIDAVIVACSLGGVVNKIAGRSVGFPHWIVAIMTFVSIFINMAESPALMVENMNEPTKWMLEVVPDKVVTTVLYVLPPLAIWAMSHQVLQNLDLFFPNLFEGEDDDGDSDSDDTPEDDPIEPEEIDFIDEQEKPNGSKPAEEKRTAPATRVLMERAQEKREVVDLMQAQGASNREMASAIGRGIRRVKQIKQELKA